MYWNKRPPAREPSGLKDEFSELYVTQGTPIPSGSVRPELVALPAVLFFVAGLFMGAFTLALLFRRIAIALAVTGPLLFSTIWILWDWKRFQSRHIALGAFAVGFTLAFLSLDREA